MHLSLVPTDDGSLTCFNSQARELCHNRAGAYSEAVKNYVEPSEAITMSAKSGELLVLDACFGLGYNSWVLLATLVEHRSASDVLVRILGLETDSQILRLLGEVLKQPGFERLDPVRQSLSAAPDTGNPLSVKVRCGRVQVELTVQLEDIRRIVPQLDSDFNLVYHDPFSPSRCPELWTVDLFKHYFRLLTTLNGRLLTYSSASAVRGGLVEAGFDVYRTAALGGKSGGTLAMIPKSWPGPEAAFTLTDQESDRMSSRSGVPYRDDGLNQTRKQILIERLREQSTPIASQPATGSWEPV